MQPCYWPRSLRPKPRAGPFNFPQCAVDWPHVASGQANSARAAIEKFQVAPALIQPRLGEGDGALDPARKSAPGPAAARNGALTLLDRNGVLARRATAASTTRASFHVMTEIFPHRHQKTQRSARRVFQTTHPPNASAIRIGGSRDRTVGRTASPWPSPGWPRPRGIDVR